MRLKRNKMVAIIVIGSCLLYKDFLEMEKDDGKF